MPETVHDRPSEKNRALFSDIHHLGLDPAGGSSSTRSLVRQYLSALTEPFFPIATLLDAEKILASGQWRKRTSSPDTGGLPGNARLPGSFCVEYNAVGAAAPAKMPLAACALRCTF